MAEKNEKLAAPEEPRDFCTNLFDWVESIVTALVVGILIFLFVGRTISVDGSSMHATLHDMDKIIISDVLYTPAPGDVVVLQTDTFDGRPLVKRIIALEGQTVDIDFEAGIVYVDGIALDEPYTNTPTNKADDFFGPVTVPEGCVFVMGDNRNWSTDSRSTRVGMVDTRRILGKAYWIIFPAREEDDRFNWSRIGSIYSK